MLPAAVLHWNYRGFTEFPIERLKGEEAELTDIYLKENLISRIPNDIGKLVHLESLYLSGNDITELPSEISKLQCLKCLDISGNRLVRIPDEIGEMRSLKFLILDENELTRLPLRIADLRDLRYLSVCDNKLEWLPQRPVFNYYHCELRFWRNLRLRTIPYSLWYHMFRHQQCRSLNIGCLRIPKHPHPPQNNRCCRLKLTQNNIDCEIDIESAYKHVQDSHACTPPSLYELSRRILYHTISETARRLSTTSDNSRINLYSDNDYENNNSLESSFQDINIDNDAYDINGNALATTVTKESYKKSTRKRHCVPADIVDEYLDFLPSFMKQEINNGPMSRCENISCKKPVFDYVVYEFCIGKITLIEDTEQVLLSAAFCSKICADIWKKGKSTISWKLL